MLQTILRDRFFSDDELALEAALRAGVSCENASKFIGAGIATG